MDRVKLDIDGVIVYDSGTVNPPDPTAWSYTYSNWGPGVNGLQSRTVLTVTPAGCTGIPILTQTCITPPIPPAGNMDAEVKLATVLSLLRPSGYYGFDKDSQISIGAGKELWFLVDPTSIEAIGTILKIHAVSWAQVRVFTGVYYRLTKDNNKLLGPIPMGNDNGWLRCGGSFPGGYPSGLKFLFKVTNAAEVPLSISAMWQFN